MVPSGYIFVAGPLLVVVFMQGYNLYGGMENSVLLLYGVEYSLTVQVWLGSDTLIFSFPCGVHLG